MKKSKDRALHRFFLKDYPADSRFAESYRTLRTNTLFSFMDKECQSILITSSGEGEGKSTTVANLAYTFAQTGKSVLMIDADLRKPALSRLMPSRGARGVSRILSDSFGVNVQSGDLGEYAVSDLFNLMSFQKRTGILHLEEETEKIDIHFFNGDLMDVHWRTRPEEKKLANILVKNRLITREQALEAFARKKHTDQKLGFILIRLGVANKEEIAGFVSLHMMEGLRTALLFKTGRFSFEKIPESRFQEPSFNPVDLKELYNQVVLGEEDFVYIKKQISKNILRTDVDKLFMMPSGPRPPKPAELLSSKRMSFLLTYLGKRFDILMIDSPPVLLTSDALLLAPRVDGVVLVVKAGNMNRNLTKKAVEQIQATRANLIGVALNQVDIRRDGYYKYYSKYYDGYK